MIIKLTDEVMVRLISEKCLRGSLRWNERTSTLTFNAQNGHSKKPKDSLIMRMPLGWIKESPKRYKVYISLPKDADIPMTMNMLSEQSQEVFDVIEDKLYLNHNYHGKNS